MNGIRPRPTRWFLGLLTSLTLVGAQAQTATQKDDDKDPAKLDAVTVTANRRVEAAQKVSGVVQAISSEQLRKDGISELRQLQTAIPGMSIANQEGNVEIYIRGVGSSNNTELGDPAAASHLNGVYIPRPRGLGMMFFDLDRVEVNKGPQGTLYGRNAMAGTLNLITAKPKLGVVEGYGQVEASSRSGRGLEAALNLPLGDTMALRAAVATTEKDYGFTNWSAVTAAGNSNAQARRAAGLKPAGLEDNAGARLSWLWTPSATLSVSAVLDQGRERGTGYPGANIHAAVLGSGLPADQLDLRKVMYRGQEGDLRNDLWGAQLKVEADLGAVIVEASASVRDVDFFQRNGGTDGIHWEGRNYSGFNYDDFSTTYWATQSRSKIAELRLLNGDPAAALRWSAGLFHFREDQQVGFLSLTDRGYCCYSGSEYTMPDVKGESSAAFVDGTFKLADDLRLLGGLRYTTEEKSRWGIGGNLALTLGAADFACCVATRFGTEGFVPALLNRPSFDLSQFRTKQQQAQWLIGSTGVAGARDTMIAQIAPIAAGTNANGSCFLRPDINNGFITNCPPNQNGGFSFANLTIPQQQDGRSSANFMDFRVGFEWDLSRDEMLYGKLSTGHKAGGFNDTFATQPIPETFKPERVAVAELGWRQAFDLAGRRGVMNLTGFYYDYKDQVFGDLFCTAFDTAVTPPECDSYSLVNRNIGASRIAGLELETRLALPAGFRLDLNAAWLDTKIERGAVADPRAQSYAGNDGGRAPIIELAGNELPLASKLNIALRLQQVIALSAGASLDWQLLASYRSSYYLTQFNEREVVFLNGNRQSALQAGFPDRQPGYTTINVGLGYNHGGLRLEAFGSNITNEQASQKAIVGSGLNLRFLNDARSYGVRARYRF